MSSSKSVSFHKIAIVMGSDSDLKIMKPAVDIIEEFGIDFEVCILSAHRTPNEMIAYAKNASSNNIKVIIAGAGGAAHLPGMLASTTTIPVIGVPVESKNLNGLDSLLSIVQMPGGVPVATVAINGSKNAGLLAIQILSLFDQSLNNKLKEFKTKLHSKVVDANIKLNTIGAKEYLEQY